MTTTNNNKPGLLRMILLLTHLFPLFLFTHYYNLQPSTISLSFINPRLTQHSFYHSSGVGLGQLVATLGLATYYASVMACIAIYLVNSFRNPLPWSECRAEWTDCIDSHGHFELRQNSMLQEDNIMTLLNNNTTAISGDRKIYSSSRLFFE